MNKYDTYFPERYNQNRPQVEKLIKEFKNENFEDYAEPTHELRSKIQDPVQEWQEGRFLPEWLEIKRDRAWQNVQSLNLDFLDAEGDLDYQREKYNEQTQSQEFAEWSQVIEEIKNYIKTYPRLEDELEIVKSMIFYSRYGKNIFSFEPLLAKMLSNTDVSDIRFKDLKLPYPTVYFHFIDQIKIKYPIASFEERNSINLPEEHEFIFDGAFLTVKKGAFEILLTFKSSDDDFNKKINISKDYRFPIYHFVLDFGNWDSDKKDFEQNQEVTFSGSTVVFADIWEENGDASEISYSKMLDCIKHPEKCYDAEWEEYVLMNECLKLIVNAICYINLKDNDKEISTTNVQANSLLEEIIKEKRTQYKHKLNEKLNKLSYTKIHFFGRKIEKEFKEEYSHGEVEPHWRRGHWRNQPFGTNLSERKLIWIRPTIVRKDKGEPIQGHIYDTNKSGKNV